MHASIRALTLTWKICVACSIFGIALLALLPACIFLAFTSDLMLPISTECALLLPAGYLKGHGLSWEYMSSIGGGKGSANSGLAGMCATPMHLPQLTDDIKHLRWTLMQVCWHLKCNCCTECGFDPMALTSSTSPLLKVAVTNMTWCTGARRSRSRLHDPQVPGWPGRRDEWHALGYPKQQVQSSSIVCRKMMWMARQGERWWRLWWRRRWWQGIQSTCWCTESRVRDSCALQASFFLSLSQE